MSDIYPQVLRQILVDHGRAACDDPRRLKALLRDYLGQHPGNHEQPINVLVLALENRTLSELLGSEGLPLEMVKSRVATRLHTSLGLTEQVAGWAVNSWAAALAPQAAVTPVPGVLETTSGGPKPVTQPMAAPRQTEGAYGSSPLNSVTEAAGTLSPLRQLPGKRPWLWLAGGAALLVVGLCAGFSLTWLLSSGGSSPSGDKIAASKDAADKAKGTTADKPVPADKTWKVIFRSADPSIWNDDVNKGPDHFAMALELAPDTMRYLRLTETSSKDFVILEKTKDKLGTWSDDPEKRYGWDGRNAFDSGAHHLGIYYRIWPTTQRGDILISWPGCKGWGFGHGHFVNGKQFYCWAGKEIPRTVFEIAVKSEPLTPAETKKLLKVGVVRE